MHFFNYNTLLVTALLNTPLFRKAQSEYYYSQVIHRNSWWLNKMFQNIEVKKGKVEMATFRSASLSCALVFPEKLTANLPSAKEKNASLKTSYKQRDSVCKRS